MEACGCVMDMIRPWQYDLGMCGCVRASNAHDILYVEVKICLITCVILLNPPFMKRNQTTCTKSLVPVSVPRQGVELVMAAFLGMNAQQRFLISLMLMFTVCLVGTLAMFILGKMSIF
jgi:hypothetical protein